MEPSPTHPEIRGVWIASHFNSPVLTSQSQIVKALDFLQESGFNVVFPAVWNRGFTAFPSNVMVNYGFPKQDPFYANNHFDPLQEIVTQAKKRNIAVIPWFEYGFASSPDDNGGHILQQKPQWKALTKTGENVKYGQLTWMNSLDREVQEFILNLILEVIQKYDINGIQGCDRLPALPLTAGYDTNTENQYQAIFEKRPPDQEKETQWVQFRADILTQFLERLFNEVKKINPKLIISMSPAVYPFCLNHLMQDYPKWIAQKMVDFIHPQLYRESFNQIMRSQYKPEIDKIIRQFITPETRAKFAPGIALKANQINLTPKDIIDCVRYNRQKGLGGQIFFFYEGLRKNNNEIALALQKEGGYNQVASLPFPLFS